MASRNDGRQYRIIVRGRLDTGWSEWLGNLTISYDTDFTILTGYVVDQSALHGILQRIRDMNLSLVSVQEMEV